MRNFVPVRKKLTGDDKEQLRQQIIDVLRQDHPQSIRHVFYRLTDPRLPVPVSKDDNGYRTVQHQLKLMRREGVIPYHWIVDGSRHFHRVTTFENAADFIQRMAGIYRANAWQAADDFVQVWCESRSLAGVLLEECDDLGVSIYPAAGFTSLSFAYEASREIISRCKGGKAAHILYVGDYDPAGVLIDQSIRSEILTHIPDSLTLTFERIGINADQIREYDLPTKPRKPGDRRAMEVEATVEAEAMPAAIMRQLLRQAIEQFIPAHALAAAKAAEESERDYLESLATAVTKARAWEGDRP
jgi:hypothetical protein